MDGVGVGLGKLYVRVTVTYGYFFSLWRRSLDVALNRDMSLSNALL